LLFDWTWRLTPPTSGVVQNQQDRKPPRREAAGKSAHHLP
jgi:hypothetical protein